MKNFNNYKIVKEKLENISIGDIVIEDIKSKPDIVFTAVYCSDRLEFEDNKPSTVYAYYCLSMFNCRYDKNYTPLIPKNVTKENYSLRSGKRNIPLYDVVDVLKPEDFFINHPTHLEYLIHDLNSRLYLNSSEKILDIYNKNPKMAYLIEAQRFGL